MRKRLHKWLRCPLCKGELDLYVKSQKKEKLPDEIVKRVGKLGCRGEKKDFETIIETGALACPACLVYYPVFNGVPRMLCYPTDVAEIFHQKNGLWINEVLSNEYAGPNTVPPFGEKSVLRNFSKEWNDYKWTGKIYWDTTIDNMVRSKHFELGVPPNNLEKKLILEVGIGIGGTSDALSKVNSCEIVGMDLGYSVDSAYRNFQGNPFFHIVQGSVFFPPFKDGMFDVVFSHGVIHHTYSTEDAFKRISKLPRIDGGMLYIWVYSWKQAKETMFRRLLMTIENAARPHIAKMPGYLQTAILLPALPLYMIYQNSFRRKKRGARFTPRYGFNEALHAARDRLTPPFAHRHTYEEVDAWFRNENYEKLTMLKDEKLPEGVPENYAINVGIRGFRGKTK